LSEQNRRGKRMKIERLKAELMSIDTEKGEIEYKEVLGATEDSISYTLDMEGDPTVYVAKYKKDNKELEEFLKMRIESNNTVTLVSNDHTIVKHL
jgi:hypothetical protein